MARQAEEIFGKDLIDYDSSLMFQSLYGRYVKT